MSDQNKKVRVRFAPSPTGHLHIGSVRVAIFNWLFAHHHKGAYLLRIEDTDRERSKQEYINSLLDALAWCDIEHDEKPILQSSRVEEHKQVVEKLLKNGSAYRCYCTPEEIAQRQKVHDGYSDLFSMYDGYCRDRQPTDVEKDKPFVVRFRVDRNQKEIAFDDFIRGHISFAIDQFDDFIIARSDGTPMYNLVVVVDDAYMHISHVIRGEDHISNTPKQILLYHACGLQVPQFAHLPLILGPSGDRLSKRDAATSVLDYRTSGYLPDAFINYLVRLGWSHGDQEVFTRNEMIEFFSLDHVGKKGAIFDPEKLAWLNGVYMRDAQSTELFARMVQDVEPHIAEQLSSWSEMQLMTLVDLYKQRVKTLRELADQLILLHDGPTSFDQAALDTWIKFDTKAQMERLIDCLQEQKLFEHEQLCEAVKALCKELGIKLVALAQPIRIALTGTSASPGIFVLLEIVGKHESIKRLKALVKYLSQ